MRKNSCSLNSNVFILNKVHPDTEIQIYVAGWHFTEHMTNDSTSAAKIPQGEINDKTEILIKILN